MSDNWSPEAYQASAAFVPKLAGKVVEWLALHQDDQVLDIGCGDGVLDAQFAEVLAQGSGRLHGIDSSPAMIAAARRATTAHAPACTFEVADAAVELPAALQQSQFDAVFSNAAMHWILRAPASRRPFLRAVHCALVPGGRFVFEMGGLGNVAAPRAALHAAVARRVGAAAARAADPWFFPDEAWLRAALDAVGGWAVVRIETEWRPTRVPNVAGWIRLMGAGFLQLVEPAAEREACVAEVAAAVSAACVAPDGGADLMGYVRLRCEAVKCGDAAGQPDAPAQLALEQSGLALAV